MLSMANQPKPEEKVFASITYVPRISDAMGRLVKEAIPNLILANKPTNPLRSIYTGMKQKVPKEDQSGVVYKIECSNCPKCYVGETKQKLSMRISQHECQSKQLNPRHPTALTEHTQRLGHTFAYDSASILQKENIKRRLQLQEVHHIILNEDTACNFKSDSNDITPCYYNLILSAKRADENTNTTIHAQ